MGAPTTTATSSTTQAPAAIASSSPTPSPTAKKPTARQTTPTKKVAPKTATATPAPPVSQPPALALPLLTTPTSTLVPPQVDLPVKPVKQPTILKPLVLSGTAAPNVTVEVFIWSIEPIIKTTTTDSQGNWQVTVNEPLEPGEHRLYTRTVDLTSGQSSELSEAQPFTVKPASRFNTGVLMGGGLITLGVIVMVVGLVL